MSNKELHSSIYKSQNCIKLRKSQKNRSCSGVVQSLTPLSPWQDKLPDLPHTGRAGRWDLGREFA